MLYHNSMTLLGVEPVIAPYRVNANHKFIDFNWWFCFSVSKIIKQKTYSKYFATLYKKYIYKFQLYGKIRAYDGLFGKTN